MIKSLRRKHRQIWTAWAVLLPVGIVLAWLVIPNQPPVKLLQEGKKPLLPLIVYSKTSEEHDIYIRSNPEKTSWQLEWKNKLALTTPSAVIYRLPDYNKTEKQQGSFQPGQAELIGRIEARGDYVFPLQPGTNTSLQLLVYDFIHQEVIEQVDF